jgi:metal-responsive CopG/Arc/MetJ family transcriptional regulator
MAIINFSVPEDIKREFQETFAGENRSAIITELMRQAIEEKKRAQRRAAAIDALLDLRRRQQPVSGAKIAAARRAGRP